MICCKLTYVNRGFQYQKKLIGFTVYSFRSKNYRVLLSKNAGNVVGATELIKDETKITLKTAIKAKNVL